MTAAQAYEVLRAPIQMLAAHEEATAATLDRATENQKRLLEQLPALHRSRAIRSLAQQQAAAEGDEGAQAERAFIEEARGVIA